MPQTENPLYGPGAQRVVERMGEAASSFLASLSPDQRRKAQLDFADDAKRTFWAYTPIPRDGLPLAEMDRPQRQLAFRLAASGLSRAGFVTASTIMGLETTLDAVENWRYPLPGRDMLLYYVSIFGEPHPTEPWGWRFEGHHISLNFTIVQGRIVAPTPTFFGANPAESPLGATATLRPLAGVEDLARELVHSLDEAQRLQAILAPIAPADIVTTNQPYVREGLLHLSQADAEEWARTVGLGPGHLAALRYTAQQQGVAASALSSGQQEILHTLIREYIHRMPDELAEIEWARLQAQGMERVHFAWAGGLERRQGHYYRIQGLDFLVEYDNTQNDANHIHSVWRAPSNDFGADILAQHYVHSH